MAEIFLSWTSANREAVKPLAKELTNLGFDLFEYEEAMPLGGEIPETVHEEIKKARLALICFDDSTYNQEWIITELAWSVAAVDDGMMDGIIPVWIGPHPEKRLPALIANRYPVFDLEERSHKKVLDLAWEIVRALPDETRHVVYGAVYSMTAEQFAEVRASDPVVAGMRFSDYLDRVCRQLGMPYPPALLDILSERYGESPGDMRPFSNGPSVMDLVYENLGRVNRERARTGAKQLFVRWVREELNGSAGIQERDAVNGHWQSGESLLILDSLSLWSADVRNEFLAASPNIDTTSIVWIPPFTQQTGALYDTLNQSWSIVQRLRNEFNRWESDPTRNVTCEVTTPFALGRWLHRTLQSVHGKTNPLRENLSQLPPASGVNPFPG